MTKIHFQTHGCSNNFHESEIMMGLLKKAEFEIVDGKEEADVIVLNICTVKGENTAVKQIKLIKEQFPDKKLILAGCITKELIKELRQIDEEASLVNTHNIDQIVSVVEETINDNPIEVIGHENKVKLNYAKKRKNPVIAIVPILSGCNHECTYCSVKLIKGKLFSYPIESVVKEARKSLISGCRELWITSQDNAAYMMDKEKPALAELMKEILPIPGNFKVRLGMMNPDNLIPIRDQVIEIFKNEKMFKFLHIPVQSGNNEILKKMGRAYTVEEFKALVKKFRALIPDLTLSTDVIVGFPSETDEQFKDTLELVKELRPDVLNISRFQPRPGTKAARMKSQFHTRVIKDRSRIMTQVFTNIALMNNERWLNWKGEILIDEIGKDESFVGRNYAYKPIIVKGDLSLGEYVTVKVTNVAPFDLRGVVEKN